MILFIQIIILIASIFIVNAIINRKVNKKGIASSIEKQINELLIELNKVVDDNIKLMEDKIEELKSIESAIDKKLTELKMQKEIQKLLEKGSMLYKQVAHSPKTGGEKSKQIRHIKDMLKFHEIMESYKAINVDERETKEKSIKDKAKTNDNKKEADIEEEVIKMYKKKVSIEAIALLFDIPEERVKLIINIYKSKKKKG